MNAKKKTSQIEFIKLFHKCQKILRSDSELTKQVIKDLQKSLQILAQEPVLFKAILPDA